MGVTLQEPNIEQPYTYTILRLDEPDPERRMLSWGTRDVPPYPSCTTAQQAAEYQIAQSRVMHSYNGPIRALLWQRGENDHYMHTPPQDAYQYDMPAREVTPETHTVILKPEPTSTLPDWMNTYLDRKANEFLNKVFPFMEDGAWGANIPRDIMMRDVRQLILEVMTDTTVHLSHPKAL